MDALPQQSIQVDGHGGYQGLAFTRFHFGHLALVQNDTTDKLYIKGSHVHSTFGRFAHSGKCLNKESISCLASAQTRPEFVSQRAELGISAPLHFGLQCTGGLHHRFEFLYFALVGIPNDFADQSLKHHNQSLSKIIP